MNKKGLNPIIDQDTEILILGSLPGDESIKQQKYYAKSSNDFWKILGEIFNSNFVNLDYVQKVEMLIKHKIGLWDVFFEAMREGSDDSSFGETVKNDFSNLSKIAPKLRIICFNGKKAGESEQEFKELGYKTKILSSSSGANRRDQQARLFDWKSIIK